MYSGPGSHYVDILHTTVTTQTNYNTPLNIKQVPKKQPICQFQTIQFRNAVFQVNRKSTKGLTSG